MRVGKTLILQTPITIHTLQKYNAREVTSSGHVLDKHPLAPALDELVQHHGHISQHKAADVEAEELCGVAGGEFEADVRGRRVLEARVFDLAGDLICQKC